jgi:hypothetical protein
MERKYFMGLLKGRVRDSTRKARLTDISMNRKAEIVIIPMMLQAKRYKRYPILQGVNSPEILLCPRAGTRERIVGIGGIGKRITDYSRISSSIPLDNDRMVKRVFEKYEKVAYQHMVSEVDNMCSFVTIRVIGVFV